MVANPLDPDNLTWRRMAIIGVLFLTGVISAGVALIVLRPFF
ncbi:MAG: hypothetical protein ABEH81_12980 [Halopenitus sp.]